MALTTTKFEEALLALVDDITSGENVLFSEAVFSKVFENSEIADTHVIQTGIRDGSVLPIINTRPNYGMFPFKDRDCGDESCGQNPDISGYKWTTGLIGCKTSVCMEGLLPSFQSFFRQCPQDISLDTALMRFLIDAFNRDFTAAMWRVLYFGDTNSESDLFDGFDGFFVQAQTSDNVVTISENAETTPAGQLLDGEAVYGYLKEMYNKAATQAWFDPNVLEFSITRTMAGALVAWLNENADKGVGCDCIDPVSLTSRRVFGLVGLRLFGIPINVRGAWDGVINTLDEFEQDGEGETGRVEPNRAILTYRENLLVGTCQIGAMKKSQVWYSQDDDTIYMRGKGELGAGIPLPNELVVAI